MLKGNSQSQTISIKTTNERPALLSVRSAVELQVNSIISTESDDVQIDSGEMNFVFIIQIIINKD